MTHLHNAKTLEMIFYVIELQDVAVVGVEDLTWGQKVAAVVVLSGQVRSG